MSRSSKVNESRLETDDVCNAAVLIDLIVYLFKYIPFLENLFVDFGAGTPGLRSGC